MPVKKLREKQDEDSLNGKLIILGAAAEPLQVPGITLILGDAR
jgi:hypothetical protein